MWLYNANISTCRIKSQFKHVKADINGIHTNIYISYMHMLVEFCVSTCLFLQTFPVIIFLWLSFYIHSYKVVFSCMYMYACRSIARARKPVQLLTRMSPQACTAAWSCCRRTPYRRHHWGTNNHRQPHSEHQESPGT